MSGFAAGRFETQAEVKRFLEQHTIFKRDLNGEIHPQRIKNLLTNLIYAGYYKYEPWGVPLTKGKHEALISWEPSSAFRTGCRMARQHRSARMSRKTFRCAAS